MGKSGINKRKCLEKSCSIVPTKRLNYSINIFCSSLLQNNFERRKPAIVYEKKKASRTTSMSKSEAKFPNKLKFFPQLFSRFWGLTLFGSFMFQISLSIESLRHTHACVRMFSSIMSSHKIIGILCCSNITIIVNNIIIRFIFGRTQLLNCLLLSYSIFNWRT